MVKKEAVIAIVIGLFLSLIITGGVLRARNAFKNMNSPNRNNPLTTDGTNSLNNPEQGLFLDITSPVDNSISSSASATLTGVTLPGTYIAIVAEKSEHLIIPNEVGQFSQDITLVKGANTVKVSVYTDSGEMVEKTLNLVYTTAEI